MEVGSGALIATENCSRGCRNHQEEKLAERPALSFEEQ